MFRTVCIILTPLALLSLAEPVANSTAEPQTELLSAPTASELTVDDLLRLVGDESAWPAVRVEACRALAGRAEMGDTSTDRHIASALVWAATQSADVDVREAACLALYAYPRQLPGNADAFHDAFRRAADERASEPASVHQSLYLLGLLERVGPEGVPALVATLDGVTVRERTIAAEILGNLGPRARSAIPALRRCLEDEDEDLHRTAATALLNIDHAGQRAIVGAVLAGRFVRLDLRRNEYRISDLLLCDLKPDAGPIVFRIREELRAKPSYTCGLLTVLQAIGSEAASAEPEVSALLESEPWTRTVAAATLWHICRSRLALDILLDTADQDDSEATNAIAALCEIGSVSRDVWETLRRIWKSHPKWRNQTRLALALWRAAPVGEVDGLRFDGRRVVVDMILDHCADTS